LENSNIAIFFPPGIAIAIAIFLASIPNNPDFTNLHVGLANFPENVLVKTG